MKKYIHYGCEKFDINRFNRVKNNPYDYGILNKPDFITGLWGSPLESENGWYNWCTINCFDTNKLRKNFIFTLDDDSKILYIRNNDELLDIIISKYNNRLKTVVPVEECVSKFSPLILDFEKLIEDGYDAIELHPSTSDIYFTFYGWDCDTILVLNPYSVKPIEEGDNSVA